MYRPALNSAVFFGLLCVLLGAIGTHVLENTDLSSRMLKAFDTAVRYQFYHCFALLFSVLLYVIFPDKWIKYAVWAFVIGIILFCGSIYLSVFLIVKFQTGLGYFGLITPIGGFSLIAGWLFLFLGINSKKQRERRRKSTHFDSNGSKGN